VVPMKIKRVATFLLIGMLFLNQSIPTFAEMSTNVDYGVGAETTITPQWENTNDVKLDLYFINGKVECVGIINGISGTSSTSAKVTRNGVTETVKTSVEGKY